jgi:hypothetical protein
MTERQNAEHQTDIVRVGRVGRGGDEILIQGILGIMKIIIVGVAKLKAK